MRRIGLALIVGAILVHPADFGVGKATGHDICWKQGRYMEEDREGIKEGLGGLKLAGGLNLGLVGGDVASGLGHAGFREDFGLGLGKGYHLRDDDGGLGLGLSHDLGCLAKDGRHACDDELGLGESVLGKGWLGKILC
ncbi:hypothetical protein Dimus_022967 [Dionaea muscipula]